MPSAAETADTYFGAVGRQDLDAMAASWKPGATSDIIGLANLTAPDGVIAWFTELFEAFPDFALVVKKVIADEESAAVHWSATATFNGTGTFEGFKPNGASIDIEGIDIITVEDGLITSLVALQNGLELARQLGVVPPAGSAADKAMAAAINAKTAATHQIKKLMDR